MSGECGGAFHLRVEVRHDSEHPNAHMCKRSVGTFGGESQGIILSRDLLLDGMR